MPPAIRAALLLLAALLLTTNAYAQDPVVQPVYDEPIGPFVIDARGLLARFKANGAIAGALDVESTDLPTRGLGLVVGAHVYPIRKRNFALGLGGEILLRARATRTAAPAVEDGPDGPTVVTRMSGFAPQLSLNFGKRNGWSYLSGGLGKGSFVTELEDSPFEDPESQPRAISYGGGARWFARKHVAFTLDLRFYKLGLQEATLDRPAFPAMTVMIFSAGVGIR
jgi:hypothetical protein